MLVEFPLEGLDLSSFVLSKTDKPPIYDLFAVSNHSGGLGGGHYTGTHLFFWLTTLSLCKEQA